MSIRSDVHDVGFLEINTLSINFLVPSFIIYSLKGLIAGIPAKIPAEGGNQKPHGYQRLGLFSSV